MLSINFLCRNKMPGFCDCTKNAMIKSHAHQPHRHVHSLQGTHQLSVTGNAFCCNESKKPKGWIFKERRSKISISSLFLQKCFYTRIKERR